MKTKLSTGLVVAGLLALSLSGPAHANSLEVSGMGTMAGVAGSFQLIYDPDLNITWLDYTKDADTWSNQLSWASSLSVNFNGQDITGWRLPFTVDEPAQYSIDGSTSSGYNNPTTSEMSHLYYIGLGNKGYVDTSGNYQPDYGLINTAPFANLISNWYWSGTEYAAEPSKAWRTGTVFGLQSLNDKVHHGFALAVLPGRIQAVPVPASLLLIGSGLAGLVGLKRRQK